MREVGERLRGPEELERWRERLRRERDPSRILFTVNVRSACGLAAGSEGVAGRLEEEVERRGLAGRVRITKTGCNGFCEREPVVTVYP
ncbi:MAG: (2Fe-2S) ferredoxin domain-containing protein, partial [Candidatus Hadarchaeales archaeon]